jgi:4-hydroxy-tetrahydrodipicolinate reductase
VIRAAVFGTGRAGQSVIRACNGHRHVEIVSGVVVDEGKAGADIGAIAGIAPLGIAATSDLDGVLARDDVDVIVYCGIGDPPYVADYLGRIVDAGKDAVTVTGFVHPPTAIGADEAAALDGRAIRGRARIVGCGLNPGFLLDVLPVVWAATCGRVRRLHALRVGEMRNWGPGIHAECGLGLLPADAPRTALSLAESAALIAAALELTPTATEETHEPYVTDVRRASATTIVEAGTTAGFRKRCRLHTAAAVIELEWLAIFCIDPAEDGVTETATIAVDGDTSIHAQANGTFFGDPYPATAARAVRAIPALRQLPPGLYRPDQLPPSI